MKFLMSADDVYARLRAAGWAPGRDQGDEAVAFADDVATRLASFGYEVKPFQRAVDFVREFAFLSVRMFSKGPDEKRRIWFDVRDYDEVDAEAFAELSEWLEQPLFPVARGGEGQIALMDACGRFFMTHWSGDYYLGENYYEVFACLLRNEKVCDCVLRDDIPDVVGIGWPDAA
ncbi:SUKH-3 domain-containing protein [Streptomyces caatingaensis]|uniref:SUKH-3 domain-containing protein n=1 Tax=Streptomyces caatingaensis TaxID=1678637 RepID=UPI0006727AD1|nr:SUKH-3 domain-containing protein [Streptomyces caatingaensis]